MRNRHLGRGCSMVVLGLALACVPLSAASAGQKAKHHKATHHHTKTKKVVKSGAGTNPTSQICLAVDSAQTSSGGLGVALEKVFSAEASDFAAAKQEMLAAMSTALKEEGPAEGALSSAPANVQAAMKGLFTFESSLQTAITNATSLPQLVTSFESLGQNPQLKTDSLTVANYVTTLCGTTTTTTAAVAVP